MTKRNIFHLRKIAYCERFTGLPKITCWDFCLTYHDDIFIYWNKYLFDALEMTYENSIRLKKDVNASHLYLFTSNDKKKTFQLPNMSEDSVFQPPMVIF